LSKGKNPAFAFVVLLAFAFVFALSLSSFAESPGERFCSLGWEGGGPALAFALALSLDGSTTEPMLSPKQKTPSFRPAPETLKRVEGEVEKSAPQPPPPTHPRRKTTTAKSLFTTVTLFTALTLSPPQAHPQGCTQCLDNTAATPPATQRAYRRAIILLTLTAGGLFATTLALCKRHH
jgi:hypothetical protein